MINETRSLSNNSYTQVMGELILNDHKAIKDEIELLSLLIEKSLFIYSNLSRKDALLFGAY